MATKRKAGSLTKGTIALFVVAMALLMIAGVGSARAALVYFSQDYTAELALPDIGVTLQENGEGVSYRDYTGAGDIWYQGSNAPSGNVGILTEHLVDENGYIMPGKAYEEAISVKNSGNIDEYVRVRLQRYWVDSDGKKTNKLTPKLIDLHFLTGKDWVENEAERTAERSVFYYTSILPVGEVTPDLTDTLTIDKTILQKVDTEVVSEKNGYTTITTTYRYNGYQFVIEAEVDAVQTHNAEDAIKSAWSIDAKIGSDGSFSLR